MSNDARRCAPRTSSPYPLCASLPSALGASLPPAVAGPLSAALGAVLLAALLSAAASAPSAQVQPRGGVSAATAPAAPTTLAAPATPAILAAQFDPAQLKADIEYLASPECMGRRVGEPGCELAAKYLEGRLHDLQVQPLPGAQSYRRGFSVTRGITVAGTPTVTLGALGAQALTLGSDYVVAAFSGSGKADAAPVVFAGYGISAPDLGWDDYSGLDVQGSAVVILRGEPHLPDKAGAFGADQPSVYSDLRRKAALARDLGAAALLILDTPQMSPPDALPEVRPAYSAASMSLPAIHLRRALLQNALIGATGLSFDELIETMNLEGKPCSAKLDAVSLSIDLRVEKDMVTGFDLVGVIPGGDAELSQQYVAIGAHYDHLGIGGPESTAPGEYGVVHPGADDNASGVAGVLALAAWAQANHAQLKRSLLVLLFSGEEEGALGSNAVVKNPPVPPGSIYCLVNMDMIGRLRDDKLVLAGTGTAAEFGEVLAGPVEQSGLKVTLAKSAFGGSDHLPFLAAGIPALFAFTGAHPQYHSPRDTADLINYGGEARVLSFVSAVLARLCNRAGGLTFQQTGGGEPLERAQASRRTVTMGTIPDYSTEPSQPGVLVGGVRPGGPAEAAGIQAGDLIVMMLDRRVSDIYDFTYALEDCQPGQKVEVKVLREGKELTFTVTLAARAVQQ